MIRRTWISVVRVTFAIFEFYWGCDALQCKAGWQEWNGACYKFSSTLVPYSDASAACKNDEANLVSIHSPEENEFVRSLTGGSDIFIGLNDSKTEGTFVWSDGSTVTYANWELGEPDDGYNMSDCVVLLGSSDGKWNDTPCIMWNEYVCKFTRAQAFQARDKNVVSKEQFFISYERNALIRHVVYKQFTSSVIHCALLCMNNPACKTINYKSVLEDEEGECELNSATAHDFPLHLIYSSHSTYSVPIG